jgi:dTMP kinase
MQHPTQLGRLVVVEGIDGAGKSSVLKRLAMFCSSRGIAHTCSREPTDGPWGRKIRESARSGRLHLDEELELFLRDREQHVTELILPALERGEVVLLDRYYFSNAAYQGARGANPSQILEQNEHFAPAPDLVLLLDLDPREGRARITGRGDVPDDFEGLETLTRVRQLFLGMQRPSFRLLNAHLSAEEVAAAAEAELERLLR